MKKFLSIILAMSLILSSVNIVLADNALDETEVPVIDEVVSGQALDDNYNEELTDTDCDYRINIDKNNDTIFKTIVSENNTDSVINLLAANTVVFPLPNAAYKISVFYKYSGGSVHSSYLTEYVLKTGKSSQPYCLMDIPANKGTQVYSIMAGTVYQNNNHTAGGYNVVIKHNDGSYSYYGHLLQRSSLSVGTPVQAGTLIGNVGMTGSATGYHLHFEWSGHDPYCEFRNMGYNLSILANSGASKYPHNHTPSSITVTTTSAQNVTETNAVVYGSCSYSGTRPSEVGVYFGTSPSNMTIVGRDTITHNKNPFDMWYNLNGKGITLSPGTTYYWQCYAVCGSEYKGEVKSFTTPGGDKTPPTISNVSVTDINKDGYTINCTISDDKNIGPIQFPTWTENNGQDDLVWHTYSENAEVSSINVSYRINCADHNNEEGTYITHIYTWDWSSNEAVYNGDITIVNIDRTAPVISNVEVTDITQDGYTVSCDITDDVQIERVEFPTWTLNNEQDDIIWHLYSENVGSNSVRASYRINTSDHNSEMGEYVTHIYAWDISGNRSSYSVPVVNVAPPNKKGDVDGNGTLNSKDGLRLLKYIAGFDVYIDKSVADVNGDGTINSKDGLRLLKYIAGFDVVLY